MPLRLMWLTMGWKLGLRLRFREKRLFINNDQKRLKVFLSRQRLVVLSLLLLSFSLGAKTFGDVDGVLLKSVYDGDTFKVDIPHWPKIISENISVRIKEIDAPEIRGGCERESLLAMKSRDFLREKLQMAKKITLKNLERGKYFRIVSDVYVDGESVSNLMITKGYAVPYHLRNKYKELCE